MEMSDDRFDTLAGGEQHGEELMARGVQIGGDTLTGGEQRGADMLAGGEQMGGDTLGGGEQRGADLLMGGEQGKAAAAAVGVYAGDEGGDEDSPELRSAA
jgi:hypothetical protein